VEKAIVAEPIKHAPLPDITTCGLFDELRKLSNKNSGSADLNRISEDHLGPINFGAGLKGLPLCAFFLERRKNFDRGFRIVEHRFNGLRSGIDAMTANVGDHLMNQPTLEGFCFRLARAKNQRVQARFWDDIQFERDACAGITLRITEGKLFIIIEAAKCFCGVSKLKAVAHVLGNKPGLPTALNGPDASEGFMFKNLEGIHGYAPSPCCQFTLFASR